MTPSAPPQTKRDYGATVYAFALALGAVYLAALCGSATAIKLLFSLAGASGATFANALALLTTGIGQGGTMAISLKEAYLDDSPASKRQILGLRVLKAVLCAIEAAAYSTFLGLYFFPPTPTNIFDPSPSTIAPSYPTPAHAIVPVATGTALAATTSYAIPEGFLFALSLCVAQKRKKKDRRKSWLRLALERALFNRLTQEAPHPPSPPRTLPTLALSPQATQVALLTFFSIGILSLATIRPNQPHSLRIFRASVLAAGAIAGGRLLWIMRSPTTFERHVAQQEQGLAEREAELNETYALKEAAIAEAEERLERQAQDQAAYVEQTQVLLDDREAELSREKQRMAEDQEAVWAQLQQEVDAQREEFEAQYTQLQEQDAAIIEQLQAQLALANAPKMPVGSRYQDVVARQIIEVLYEYDCPVDFEDSLLTRNDIQIWLQLRPETPLSKLKTGLEQLPHRLKGINKTPELEALDGSCLITIPRDQSVDLSAEEITEEGIVLPPADHLEYAARVTHHWLICGGTGSGKSTYADNAINLSSQIFWEENKEETEVFYIDPKFPDTEWQLNGIPVLPQFQGYDLLSEAEKTECPQFKGTAQDGAIACYKFVRNRLRTAAAAVRRGEAKPDRNPQLWVIDEVPEMVGRTEEEWNAIYDMSPDDGNPVPMPNGCKGGRQLTRLMVASIKNTQKVGRSQKVKTLLMGQSWLPSDFGFRIPDLAQSTLVFLGATYIRNAIADRKLISDYKYRRFLQKQVSLMEAAAENGDEQFKYIALYKVAGKQAYLAPLPPPQYYEGRHLFLGDPNCHQAILETEKLPTPKAEISPEAFQLDPETAQFHHELETELHGDNPPNVVSFSDRAEKVETRPAVRFTPSEYNRVKFSIESGASKTHAIKTVWDASPGGNKAYREASAKYDAIAQQIKGETDK